MNFKISLFCFFGFSINVVAQSTTITLTSVKDNTIFSDNITRSNATGQSIYVGKVGNIGGGAIRRGLLRFDLSSIPANATITSASLTMATLMAASPSQNTFHNFTIHKLTKDWGEGTSFSLNGQGVAATSNDATWQYSKFSSSSWTSPGGDFVQTASATTSTIVGDPCIWSSSGLISDIQSWINTPSTNFGWLIKGQENTLYSAKVFASRENNALFRPKLTITYTTAPPPPTDGVLVSELNPQKRWIELYNPSSSTISLSNYWVSNTTNTAQINSLNILNGNLSLESGKYIVLNWGVLNQTDDELALYNGNPNTGGTLMKDYLQYGSANHSRASAAVTAQAWDNAASFLPTIAQDTLSYSLNPNNTYNSGLVTNSVDFLTQRQTPTLRNTLCPASLTLSGNIIDAKYTSNGALQLSGTLNTTSKVNLSSPQAIIFSNVIVVPNGAIFEAKISNCY